MAYEGDFCRNCGASLDGPFCSTCGTAVRAEQVEDQADPPRRRRRMLLGAVALATIMVLGVIAGSYFLTSRQASDSSAAAKAKPVHVIAGSMTLGLTPGATTLSPWTPNASCGGTGSFNDVAAGTSVIIKDGSGNIIATGNLDAGTAGGPVVHDGIAIRCTLPFRVTGVPDVPFYQIDVGHREGISYSKSDMEAHSWSVTLSLGTL